MLYCIVFGAGFLVFGLLFAAGVLLEHIPGWSQMPPKERQAVRVRPLCRNIGFFICLAGILLLLGAALPVFLESGLRWAMTGWFVLCAADLVWIRKSARYGSNGMK